MLFSRVYNWIKYKTLPPSVLFLNRLFVERDSKHRRVLSNLGLTFRNSKWSMYARTNVQDGGYAHLHMHLLTLLSLTGITVTMYYVLPYYSFATVFNCVLSPIWFLWDLELYTSSFYVFLSWTMLDRMTTSAHKLIFTSSLTSKGDTTNNKLTENTGYTCIPKRFYKSILYRWSTANTIHTIDIFEDTTNARQFYYQNFYKQLYTLVKVATLDKNSLISYKRMLHSCTPYLYSTLQEATTASKFLCDPYSTSYSMLLFNYGVRVKKINFVDDTKEFNLWTFDQLLNERGRLLSSSLAQPFYISQITYNLINQSVVRKMEFTSLLNSLEFQINLRSTHKWMYKYSLLHRTSLRDPSQVTPLLKHLAPSFYMSTFFSRNMWNSSTLNVTESPYLHIGSYQEALYTYNSLYSKDNILQLHPLFRNLNNFSQLTLFTTSYNWVLQRFYLFNALSTHTMRWNTNNNTTKSANLQKLVYNSRSSSSYFQWHLNNKSWAYVSPVSTFTNPWERIWAVNDLKSASTLYLNYVEYTLFSKLNIETGLNLITNQGAPVFTSYSVQPLLDESLE